MKIDLYNSRNNIITNNNFWNFILSKK
jgi:hypothetical protein